MKKKKVTEDELVCYGKKIKKLINKILVSKNNHTTIDDIMLNKYIGEHIDEIDCALFIKQLQMKIGKIWQVAIGNYADFKDLGIGHHSGLDVKNKNKKLIIELKNRHNTDNYSSRKSNYKKLVDYKKTHPKYTCIYAVINDKHEEGRHKIIHFDNHKIHYYSGMCLLEFIFGDNANYVINILHKIIDAHLS